MSHRAAARAVRFPSTHWSLVGRAGHPGIAPGRAALGVLLQRYLPALRSHLVAKGASVDSAEDLVQGFVADKVIGQNLLARAARGRGKFRSFLLGALDHYAASQFRRDNAAKRRPAKAVLDIAGQPDVACGSAEPSWQFTLAWAREVVQEATRRMEAHCTSTGRSDLLCVFTERVARPAAESTGPSPHAALAGDLQLGGAKAASNLLVTSKRLYARILRGVVAEYAADDRAVDAEIQDLMRVLSGGR